MKELKLTTRHEALNLLAKVGCSPSVIRHCEKVSELAVKIAQACQKKNLKVDISLVEISALLHDIGRSKTHNVNHALIGGQIANSFGLPREIVSVIERHSGGGISREEAKKLGWPAKNYLPKTLEEKIVCYADKRVEGLRVVPIERSIESYASALGRNHSAIKRIWRLHREIMALVGEFDADSDVT